VHIDPGSYDGEPSDYPEYAVCITYIVFHNILLFYGWL
jgi:hypothetical protein